MTRKNLEDYPTEEKTIETILPDKKPSPEELVIRKDIYEKLSNESQELIKIVIELPSEFFSLVTTPKGMVTKKSVRRFIESKWPIFTVNYVLEELKQYVKQFK